MDCEQLLQDFIKSDKKDESFSINFINTIVNDKSESVITCHYKDKSFQVKNLEILDSKLRCIGLRNGKYFLNKYGTVYIKE